MASLIDLMYLPESILQQLTVQTKSLLFVIDPYQKIIHYLSDSAADFFGIDALEAKKAPAMLEALLHPDDKDYLRRELNQLGRKTCLEADFRLLMPDKTVKWLHVKACKLKNTSSYQNCVAGFAEDITERKEYEVSVSSIHAQKDTALQILSHDLRAPINTITSATKMMGHEMSPLEVDKIQPYFEIINTTCRNALEMINELLSSIYWDTQKKSLSKRINLVKKVENQLATYRLLHKGDKEFELHTAEQSLHIKTDPIRLQLVLENLLTNAFKFTKAKGRIRVSLEKHADKVLIEVADNGIGIPEALQPLIFEKFSKARRSGLQGEKSVGLGLHIVKTLVEQLQGKIWFESQKGKGTSFFVELPLELHHR